MSRRPLQHRAGDNRITFDLFLHPTNPIVRVRREEEKEEAQEVKAKTKAKARRAAVVTETPILQIQARGALTAIDPQLLIFLPRDVGSAPSQCNALCVAGS